MLVFIPYKIRSENEFIYSHWRKYKKYKDAWYWILKSIVRFRKPRVTDYQTIKIWSIRKRILDYGNLVGGCKPVPDALIRLGWLVDDSPSWCKIHYDQVKLGETDYSEEGTVLEL